MGGGAAPNSWSGAAREQHAHSRGRQESWSPAPRSAARGWGHADSTQEAVAAALLSLCLRQAFGFGRRKRSPIGTMFADHRQRRDQPAAFK
jgi:hypothetical protein